MGEHLRKGRPVLIDGRLKQESWEDKSTGKKRYAVKIVINSFQFVGAKDEGEPAKTRKPAATEGDAGNPPPEEEDVPF